MKKELVSILMESPLYWTLTVRERLEHVKFLISCGLNLQEVREVMV